MNILKDIVRRIDDLNNRAVRSASSSSVSNNWPLLTTKGIGLEISTVYACVDTISKTFASLPATIMQYDGDSRRANRLHAYHRFISREIYPGITPYEGRRMICMDYLLHGNGYLVQCVGPKGTLGFKPVRPWEIAPFRTQDNLLYYFSWDKDCYGVKTSTEVIHLKDLGERNDLGYSKIDLHAITIGKEKAAGQFINELWSNHLTLGAVIEYPRDVQLSPDQISELRKFGERYRGYTRGMAGGVDILDSGGQLKQLKMDMPLNNAQYVESAKLNVQEICRIYSCPPPKIGHTEGTPYNSLESLNQDYWQNCILPIVTLFEQRFNMQMLGDDHELTHDYTKVLSADISNMGNYFSSMYRIGVLSRNEIRSRMDLNPVDGGDIYYIEGNNMVEAN